MPAILRNKWTWLAALGILVVVVGWFYLGAQAKQKAAAARIAASKVVASPYTAIAAGKVDVEGGIIQVAARTPGVVQTVNVQEGDAVTKGQILAQLENSAQELAVANAQAAVAQAQAQIGLLQVQKATAQREYARLQPLMARQFIATQSVDSAADAIKTADAQIANQRAAIGTSNAALNVARYQLELTRVRAPADGRIVRRYANPGTGASTLNVSNLFDLEPATARIVRAEIAESDLPNVTIGQAAQISPESEPTKVYLGAVLRRSSEFGARKLLSDDPSEKTDERVVEVVVSAEGAPLLIGQRVLVKFMKPAAGRTAPRTSAKPVGEVKKT